MHAWTTLKPTWTNNHTCMHEWHEKHMNHNHANMKSTWTTTTVHACMNCMKDMNGMHACKKHMNNMNNMNTMDGMHDGMNAFFLVMNAWSCMHACMHACMYDPCMSFWRASMSSSVFTIWTPEPPRSIACPRNKVEVDLGKNKLLLNLWAKTPQTKHHNSTR